MVSWHLVIGRQSPSITSGQVSCQLLAVREMAKLQVAGVTLLHVLAFGAGCILDLPTFRDHRDDGIDRIPDLSQAIIPAYQFTCTGRVIQWGACFHRRRDTDRYYIRFQVWRQVSPGYYQLVGHNSPEAFTAVASYPGRFVGAPTRWPRYEAADLLYPVDHCNLTSVPYEEQVIVQPGDVVGFYSDHWRVERSRFNDESGDDSIQIATESEYVGTTVYYQSGLSHSDLSTSSAVGTTSGDCAVSDSCLQLQSVIQGAPVMTAVVDPIPTPVVAEDSLMNNSQISTILTSPNASHSCSDTVQKWLTVTSSPTGSQKSNIMPSVMSQQSQNSPPIALIVGILLSVIGLASLLVSLVVVAVARAAYKMEKKRILLRPRTDSLEYNVAYDSATHIYSSKDSIVMTSNCAYKSKDVLDW